ncbi:MAG: thioredoxin family protein [Rubripirellula sp.]
MMPSFHSWVPRVSLLAVFLFVSTAVSGEFNQVLSIGDPAPQWKGLAGVDGELHDFEQWDESKLIIVVFTCNSCPYAVDAEDRLIDLQKRYADKGVSLVAINVNKVEEDLLPAMRERSEEKGYPFPYLFDETQQIARQYGAMATPECYLLDQKRDIRYMGSIDDSPDGKNIGERYLEHAIEALLGGNAPAITETVPIGCRVRFERVRRSRKAKPINSSENEE